MITEFPDEPDLIRFFESQPRVAEEGREWIFNTLVFSLRRDVLELQCTMRPSYGDFELAILQDGRLLSELKSAEVRECKLHFEGDKEYMILRFPEARSLRECVVWGRPFIGVRFGMQRSRVGGRMP